MNNTLDRPIVHAARGTAAMPIETSDRVLSREALETGFADRLGLAAKEFANEPAYGNRITQAQTNALGLRNAAQPVAKTDMEAAARPTATIHKFGRGAPTLGLN